MEKIARIVFVGVGLTCAVLVITSFNSRSTAAQAPVPVLPVRVTNVPLPVQGAVNANVTNTVPVSGNVNAAAWEPDGNAFRGQPYEQGLPGRRYESQFFELFTFNNYVVKANGVLEPFTLPAGQVLVVTQFDWEANGSSAVANQTRTAYLQPSTTQGFNAVVAQSSAL